jgi:hypothetical protein
LLIEWLKYFVAYKDKAFNWLIDFSEERDKATYYPLWTARDMKKYNK